MSTADLVSDSLAVARIIRLVQVDDIAEPVRAVLRRTSLESLTTCPWCLGVWAAAGLTGLRLLLPRVGRAVSTGLAAAYVGSTVETWLQEEVS